MKRIYDRYLRLEIIKYLFNYKGSTVSEIKNALNRKYVKVYQVLSHMENAKLVIKKKNIDDVYQYDLTEKGKRIFLEDYADDELP